MSSMVSSWKVPFLVASAQASISIENGRVMTVPSVSIWRPKVEFKRTMRSTTGASEHDADDPLLIVFGPISGNVVGGAFIEIVQDLFRLRFEAGS